jgi:hypothetical protein
VDREDKSGISVQTLVVSTLSAVAAAVVVPLIWDRGTLIATAMTPVIVALTSEALRKPAEKITAVTPKVTRRSATGAAVRAPERFEPLPADERDHAPEVRDDDPFGLRAAPKPGHHWKIAAATGLAAFVIGVIALTASELVFGGPATKGGGKTTFFDRGSKATATPTATPTASPDASREEATPTATPSATPTATETATPTATPSTEGAPPAAATATPTP